MNCEVIRPDTRDFLSGVVEGFYGRPWTHPQRRELFRRMQIMGLNSYLYAPKDDLKHRNNWRVFYTPEEEIQLRSLIEASKEHNVIFIFALSPGIDIQFSNEQDVVRLKKKLNQIANLGCTAFALLFDDIEARLNPEDLKLFKTAAKAQATITNEVYGYLNKPHIFLFCPTEYCEGRAFPSVNNSSYLNTLGTELDRNIIVLWTGPLVVSKKIPSLGIRDLNLLLNREVAIWDNLYANDYDQRRVFLGPYSGRPLALKRQKLLRGVLINPNCEFEANYIAMHTLAQWTRHANPKHSKLISTQLDMEDEGDDELMYNRSNEINETIIANTPAKNKDASNILLLPIYRPRDALVNALKDWLALMYKEYSIDSQNQKEHLEPMETNLKASNSEVQIQLDSSDSNGSVDIELKDLILFSDLFYLPFEHGSSALKLLELAFWLRDNAYYASGSADSVSHESLIGNPISAEWKKKFLEYDQLVASITKLRDRFLRLPYRGVIFDMLPYLNDIHIVLMMTLDFLRWLNSGTMALKSYAHLRSLLNWYSQGYGEMVTSGIHEPWKFRGGIVTELHRVLPLDSSQDLFPALNRAGPNMVFQGGAIISTAIAHNIQNVEIFSNPSSSNYIVRPFSKDDKAAIYDLCRRKLLHRLRISPEDFPSELGDLPGDRYLLSYIEHSPNHCFVLEQLQEENSTETRGKILGYAFGAPDVVAWARDFHTQCLTSLCKRYLNHIPVLKTQVVYDSNPRPNITAEQLAKDLIIWFNKKINLNHLENSNMREKVDDKKGSLDYDSGTPSLLSTLVEMASITPPPDPLGASVPDLELASTVTCLQQAVNEPFMDTIDTTIKHTEDKQEIDLLETQESDQIAEEMEVAVAVSSIEKVVSNKIEAPIPDNGTHLVSSLGCPPEAIYAALAAHPASMLFEIDDPEIETEEIDTLTLRLIVCLLSSLRMVATKGIHIELDEFNECRAEFFRHYGFYSLPISSLERSVVYARMI